MYSVSLECSTAEKDFLISLFWEHGTAGLVERDLPGGRTELRAFFEDEPAALAIAARTGGEWRKEEEYDWVAATRDSFQPILAGQRFFIVPSWRNDPTPSGRLRIELDPGRAFGTGSHETTQLCLEALERLVKPGTSVLDLGTGSGILAIAAALLGAKPVWACDIDADAVEVARENIARAGVAVHRFAGSARSVRPGSVGLVVANINATTITNLAQELARLLAPGGGAVLSGFLVTDRETIESTLALREWHTKGDWACVVV